MLQAFFDKHQIEPQKIAVGVSGGADSLATVLMCQEKLASSGYQVIALTVDHELRASSKKEALYVKNLMKEKKIEHHTLVWKGIKPQKGVEEAARTARYELLEDWCKQHNIRFLITAHHLLDQAETFLMRLERGSGLDGLCGMKEVTTFKSIQILRPFLQTHPDVFKAYLGEKDIKWIEDESNNDKNLLRVRMRQFLPVLERQTGISAKKIVDTMERLKMSRTYFDDKIQTLIKNNFKNFNNLAFSCSSSFFQTLDSELEYRLICFILRTIAQTTYQPESQKVLKLIEKIRKDSFKASTLNHCQIKKQNTVLWFLPEKTKCKKASKQDWNAYLLKHPIYRKIKIPALLKDLLVFQEN